MLTLPNGCHICEVGSILKPAEAILDRYTVVDDIGTVLNRLLARGQIQGGGAQGAGQALAEDVVYDEGSGQLLTGTLTGLRRPARGHIAGRVLSAIPSEQGRCPVFSTF